MRNRNRNVFRYLSIITFESKAIKCAESFIGFPSFLSNCVISKHHQIYLQIRNYSRTINCEFYYLNKLFRVWGFAIDKPFVPLSLPLGNIFLLFLSLNFEICQNDVLPLVDPFYYVF